MTEETCDGMNRQIRLVLITGMVISVLVTSLGLILYAMTPDRWSEIPLSLGEIASGISNGNPIAWIDLGIILLIATPLTRVAASVLIFISRRDMRFAGVAILVLVVISLAVVLGG